MFLKKMFIVFSFLILAQVAEAANILFNPGNYMGGYSIAGQTNTLQGAQLVDLSVGSYQVIVGSAGSFDISVDAGGSVSVSNPAAAVGGMAAVTFNNATINIDPGLYQGMYGLGLASGLLYGQQSVVLVPSINYLIQIGAVYAFYFAVDASGNLFNVGRTDSAAATGSTLTFKTSTINIQAQQYSGQWYIANVTGALTGSSSDISLVLGGNYQIVVGGVGSFLISFDSSGAIVVLNGVSATSLNNQLAFSSYGVDVNPGTYSGLWRIDSVTSPVSGAVSNVQLLPGINYMLDIATAENFIFSIQSPCSVTPSTIPFSQGTFVLNCNAGSLPPEVQINLPISGATISNSFNLSVQSSSPNLTQMECLLNGQQVAATTTNTISSVVNVQSFANGAATLLCTATNTLGLVGNASIPLVINNVIVVPSPTAELKFKAEIESEKSFKKIEIQGQFIPKASSLPLNLNQAVYVGLGSVSASYLETRPRAKEVQFKMNGIHLQINKNGQFELNMDSLNRVCSSGQDVVSFVMRVGDLEAQADVHCKVKHESENHQH